MALINLNHLRDRAVNSLGGVTKEQASQRAFEAYASGYNDGEDEPVSGTTKRYGYKSLTSAAIRDLGGLDHDTVLNTAWKLFLSNPVAARALKLKRDYILGSGVQIQTEDDDLKEILDAFWQDNKLDARLKKFILQLRLLGSQCFPVFVRESDGRARLGYIDPSQIERVITHPDNVLEKWAVCIKESEGGDAWVKYNDKRVYRIVRQQEAVEEEGAMKAAPHEGRLVTHEQATLEEWEAAMLAAYGLSEYTGTCFYFSVNELSNQERGFSDLLQEADWLDQLDATLFALGDREAMADYFSFDVMLEGADKSEIKQRAAEFRKDPPKKGSVNVHNERETWNMNRPDLKQAGSIEASRTLLRFALGGLGMPEHWYAYGNETNRATAEAQGTPTFRSMEADQDDTRDLILALCHFVRDQAVIAGALADKSVESEIEVVMPEMTTRDMNTIAQALGVVAQALLTIDTLGLLTRDTMARVWAKFVAEAGVEYDPKEELEKVDEEEEEEPLPGMTPQQAQAITGANGNQPPEGQTPPQLAPFAQTMKDMGQ